MNRNFGETASLAGRLPSFYYVAGVVFFLYICFVCISCSSKAESPSPYSVTLITEDGFSLVATLYVPAAKAPPGIILIHRYGGNRKLWEHIAQILQQRGILVLALDLRGHGDSSTRQGESIHYRQLPEDGWNDALQDVRAAKKMLLEKGANPDNLAVGGEGLGAALALHYTLEDPDMQGVIMISPGLESNGIANEAAIKQLTDCPTLLIASEGDAYAATSATALNQAAPVYSELRTWSGGAHGVDVFAAHPEAIEFMLQWLHSIFASKTPQ